MEYKQYKEGFWGVIPVIIIALVSFGIGGYVYITFGQGQKQDASPSQSEGILAEQAKDDDVLKENKDTAEPITKKDVESTIVSSEVSVPEPRVIAGWGTVSSGVGFSLQYPYEEIGAGWGDDEYFQVSFFFPPSEVTLDAGTVEKLSDDINNMRIGAGLDIVVIEDDVMTADFNEWVRVFLEKEDSSYGNKGRVTVLSEKTTPTTFAGRRGYKIVRLLEGAQGQGSLHYTQKEIFVRVGKFVYRISHTAPSDDTVFPRSGLVGREYLQHVNDLSEEILTTFVFDDSTVTAIVVPQKKPQQLTGDVKQRRENLLASLRVEPFYDEKTSYPTPSNSCVSNFSTPQNKVITPQTLAPARGLFIGANDEYADVHAYDELGNHTGPMPEIPGLLYGAQIEELLRGVGSISLGSAGYGLVIDEFFDGRIVLKGKKYGFINFSMRGDGNACTVVEFFVPVTPYSIATLPITKNGDVGPFSYDIDGDGVEDFMLSLLYPLSEQKELDINAVMADMQSMDK